MQSRLDCVVRETQGLTAPSAASAPVTATATQLMPEAKTPGAISTLWKDSSLQGLEQLSNELTADDPMGVEYSSTDLEGIGANA